MAEINPLNEKSFDRLHKSIVWSQRQLKFPRRERVSVVREFIGTHHSERGAVLAQPVNMNKLAVDIYRRQLVPKSPRAMITTMESSKRPAAANFELALNQIPKEIDLTTTLRRFVTEALFSVGVVKVGLHTVGEVMGFAYGKPFVDLITIDDFFFDMTVKYWSECSYEGNDYWIDFDMAKEAKWIKKNVRDDLEPDEYTILGTEGEDRTEGIQQASNPEVFHDKVWVRDVWLEREKLLVTYGIRDQKVFRVIEWDGPDHSPYYKLGFTDVPGMILPLAPISVWRDLNELGNTLFRKIAKQATDQKSVSGFGGGDEEGALAFKNARDGDGITYTGPPPVILSAGGVDPQGLATYLQVRDLSSYFAGNIDSLGGLSPQTQTVGQDKLLSEAAGAQMRDMADSVVKASNAIFEALAWYEWHDPVSERTLEKPIPGTDLSIPVQWDSESRQGDIKLFDMKIDAYSLQDDSPGIRLQKLGMLIQNYVMPLAPMIDLEGGTINSQKILETAAKLADFPELNEFVTWVNPAPIAKAGQKPTAPANTSREYVHSSRPGMSREGASAVMQQTLMGGRVQGAQEQGVADRGPA